MSLVRNGRVLLFPAEVLLNTDLLRMEIFRMCDISMMAQSIIGGWPSVGTPSAIAAGLNATPAVTPAFSVFIAPGVIYQYEEFDATAYPSDGSGLAADTSQFLYKQAINLAQTQLDSFNPPGSGGNSIAYLIQAQLATNDTESTTRQYYNPSAPSVPITIAANDVRTDVVSLSIKASSAAPSPTIPTPDAGNIGLWVVTVPNGATVITTGMISVYATTSFISETLTQKVSYKNLQNSGPIYGIDTSGAANTITVTATPAYTEIVPGTHIYVKVANTNTSGTSLVISGLASKAVKKLTPSGLVVLTGGEVIANGIYEFMYDGTQYQLLSIGQTAIGRMNRVVITGAGTSTYTPTPGLMFADVTQTGPGGGGGGSLGSVSGIAASGGGGQGGKAIKLFTAAQIGASQTVINGAKGTGGAAGNNNGTAGTTSSFGAFLSVTGGSGGSGSSSATGNQTSPGGVPGMGSGGDINMSGQYGTYGLALTTDGAPGSGGGGVSAAYNVAGTNATNAGDGGSGSACDTTSRAGGNGQNGETVILEYIAA